MSSMLVHVAVADSRAPYAKGLTMMLRARGVGAVAPSSLEAWAAEGQVKIAFVNLSSELDWRRLEALHLLDESLLIVAVMDVMDRTACVRALNSGAVSILPRDIPVVEAVEIVDSLTHGRSSVPVAVMQALIGRLSPFEDLGGEEALSSTELGWLRRLAEGSTVRDLADSVGYSEREMFRILRSLYGRMKVGSRIEALFLARERGWI